MRFCVIASPAKTMNIVDGPPYVEGMPPFMERTVQLMHAIQELDYADAKALWQCSDELAQLNYERFSHMDLQGNLTPAVLAYEGIQYTHIAAGVLDQPAIDWLQEHFRILSGFYGVLRSLDGIVPYRLEMQAKLAIPPHKNLYAYWGSLLAEELSHSFDTIVDVASLEYSKAVVPHALKLGMRVVSCKFGVMKGGAFKQPSTEAKAARGTFTRWCAENGITDAADLVGFAERGYVLDESCSSADELIFVKKD